jgi:hypothetical protein
LNLAGIGHFETVIEPRTMTVHGTFETYRARGPTSVIGAEGEVTRTNGDHQESAIAVKSELAKQQGYRPVSFEDFKLDGKTLAEANAKLILQGFYSKSGGVEVLQPTGLAVATAKRYGNDSGIPVLSEDAARNVRKYFLECGNNPLAQLGCPVTVSGHADLCTVPICWVLRAFLVVSLRTDGNFLSATKAFHGSRTDRSARVGASGFTTSRAGCAR